jgi:murein L,D-transpeptidase YafK
MKKNMVVMVLLVLGILQADISFAYDIPSSRKSKRVITRVRPILAKDLLSQGLSLSSPIFIRIFKKSAELEVWVKNFERFKLFKTYKLCRFSGSLGPKIRLDDRQSPEGFYYVKPDQLNPSSQYHLSFNIGYPNSYDKAHGRTGSALMVHGDCVSIGCYAMTDERIEEIYTLADAAFRGGQPFFRVHIFPFRMTKKNMEQHKNSRWHGFWKNLKQGYDIFKNTKIPPNVMVRNKKYVFEKT